MLSRVSDDRVTSRHLVIVKLLEIALIGKSAALLWNKEFYKTHSYLCAQFLPTYPSSFAATTRFDNSNLHTCFHGGGESLDVEKSVPVFVVRKLKTDPSSSQARQVRRWPRLSFPCGFTGFTGKRIPV